MEIIDLKAREILDSRGNPTVEVDVFLENGIMQEQLFHQELQLVNVKHLKCVMAIKKDLVVKEYLML